MRRYSTPLLKPWSARVRHLSLPDLKLLRRWPLPTTTALAVALIVVPLLMLRVLPRRAADHLGPLPEVAELMQSFRVRRTGGPPILWRERLGEDAAEKAWDRAGSGNLWWRFWPSSSDFSPVLAIPTRWWPDDAPSYPPNSRLEGDLLLVAADPLQSQQLAGFLTRATPQVGSDWTPICREQLLKGPAVLWGGSALEGMAGALVPFLQPIRRGCLSLSIAAGQMEWQGIGTTAAHSTAAGDFLEKVDFSLGVADPMKNEVPLEKGLLLQLRGQRLGWLLDDLLDRRSIRSPLEERYGLTSGELSELREAPFQLKILPSEGSRYKATLRVSVRLEPDQQQRWRGRDADLQTLLRNEGFQLSGTEGDRLIVRNAHDQPIASWWWLPWGLTVELGVDAPMGNAPTNSPLAGGTSGKEQTAETSTPETPFEIPANVTLHVQARPDALAQLNLLPRRAPAPIRLASEFSATTGPQLGHSASPSYELTGWLDVLPATGAPEGERPVSEPESGPGPASLPTPP